jgi:anti-sigma factor RsiW
MITTPMDCLRAREALLDDQHGRLGREAASALRAHLQTCPTCSKIEVQERWLNDLLRTRLSRPAAPRALRERLTAQLVPPVPESPRRSWRRARTFGAAIGAAALLAAAALVMFAPMHQSDAAPHPLLREAVNDHLRVVYAQNPIEIESGGIHQVKPWFTGRLDFAPDLAFSGDDDFPLVGGAVGYFIDRKAATLVFKRRLHTISCFVFPTRGLPWPSGVERELAPGHTAHMAEIDGFHVVMWRGGDLGHALVSDVNEADLLRLGARLAQSRPQ